MKKKLQMNALSAADNKTGRISKVIARSETIKSKMNATTLYPRNPERKKQNMETTIMIVVAYKYCLPWLSLLKRSLFMVALANVLAGSEAHTI